MKNSHILTAIMFTALSIGQCFASFDYNGVFTSGRLENDVHSYYILLKENTDVTFLFRKAQGEAINSIFVNSIKLTSDDSKALKSDKAIESYSVSETGIYEISVVTNLPVSEEIAYELQVDEKSKEESNNTKSVVPGTVVAETTTEEKTKVENQTEEKISEVASTTTQTIIFPVEENVVKSSEELNNSIASETVTEMNTVKSPESSGAEIKTDAASETVSENVPTENIKVNNFVLDYKSKFALKESLDIYSYSDEALKCWPQALCFDSDNNLYVLDSQLCRVIVFDSNLYRVRTFGTKGSMDSEFGLPTSIAVNDDYVLVGDRQKHCIHAFSHEGEWKFAVKNSSANVLNIANPSSIIFRSNEIWVGDSVTQRILCFDKNFSFLGSFGSTNEAPLKDIVSIAYSKNSIFVLEESGALKRFSPMGAFEAAISTDFSFVVNLFADSNGNLWVCDQDKGCVRCFNMEDEILATIDGETIGDGQNNRIAPSAFAISPSGIVAIADVRSRQVKILEIK